MRITISGKKLHHRYFIEPKYAFDNGTILVWMFENGQIKDTMKMLVVSFNKF